MLGVYHARTVFVQLLVWRTRALDHQGDRRNFWGLG